MENFADDFKGKPLSSLYFKLLPLKRFDSFSNIINRYSHHSYILPYRDNGSAGDSAQVYRDRVHWSCWEFICTELRLDPSICSLAEHRDQFTSLELQKKSLTWWND